MEFGTCLWRVTSAGCSSAVDGPAGITRRYSIRKSRWWRSRVAERPRTWRNNLAFILSRSYCGRANCWNEPQVSGDANKAFGFRSAIPQTEYHQEAPSAMRLPVPGLDHQGRQWRLARQCVCQAAKSIHEVRGGLRS